MEVQNLQPPRLLSLGPHAFVGADAAFPGEGILAVYLRQHSPVIVAVLTTQLEHKALVRNFSNRIGWSIALAYGQIKSEPQQSHAEDHRPDPLDRWYTRFVRWMGRSTQATPRTVDVPVPPMQIDTDSFCFIIQDLSSPHEPSLYRIVLLKSALPAYGEEVPMNTADVTKLFGPTLAQSLLSGQDPG